MENFPFFDVLKSKTCFAFSDANDFISSTENNDESHKAAESNLTNSILNESLRNAFAKFDGRFCFNPRVEYSVCLSKFSPRSRSVSLIEGDYIVSNTK